MKFNINESVLVRERPSGKKEFDRKCREIDLDPEVYRSHLTQPDGRLKMQLWDVMHTYGNAMLIGYDPPIETEIELVMEKPNETEDHRPT